MQEEPWYGVRCVFQTANTFEERITLWRADDFDNAIEKVEAEAQQYADIVSAEYLGLAQAFHVASDRVKSGTEVFSLMRDSDLEADDYLRTFSRPEPSASSRAGLPLGVARSRCWRRLRP